MRLRHKKGAEELILNSKYCINNLFNAENNNKENNIKCFNNTNDIYLELGTGKGRFIIENAINNPNTNYIGIEKSATILLKTIDNLESKMNELNISAISNLKFLCIDIISLENYIPNNTISKIFLNFSDPWPKDRHYKRRLTYKDFLNKYYNLLKNDGIIEFKTDQKDLFNFTLEEIKETKFKLLIYTYDLHNDTDLNKDNIMTEYEEKFSKLGNKICKLILRKC